MVENRMQLYSTNSRRGASKKKGEFTGSRQTVLTTARVHENAHGTVNETATSCHLLEREQGGGERR